MRFPLHPPIHWLLGPDAKALVGRARTGRRSLLLLPAGVRQSSEVAVPEEGVVMECPSMEPSGLSEIWGPMNKPL